MSIGDPVEINFKALVNSDDLYYAVFLMPVGQSISQKGTGPLTLKPIKLKQGVNSFKWDGRSYGWAPSDAPEIGQLKKGPPEKYYFNIYLFDSPKVNFLGMMANYHTKSIVKLRSKNFQIN